MSKLLATFIGVMLAIVAISNADFSEPIVENWWGNGTFVAQKRSAAVDAQGNMTALSNNFDSSGASAVGSKGSFFSTPQFQAVLSPRMYGGSYSANVKYNMPDRANQGVPCNPLSQGDMASENYQHPPPQPRTAQIPGQQVQENYGCGLSCSGNDMSCGKGGYGLGKAVAGGYPLQSDYHGDGGGLKSNWQSVYDSLPGAPVVTESLPVATMSSMDAQGNMQQVVVTDRLFSVNSKNRNAGLADLIRGDLPITPCNSGWFNVSVNPATSLWAGAMVAMGGDGSTNNATMDLMMKSTGGTNSAYGGADLKALPHYKALVQGSAMMGSSAGGGDIQVTAFP
jgi:hypothetical protein